MLIAIKLKNIYVNILLWGLFDDEFLHKLIDPYTLKGAAFLLSWKMHVEI